MYPPSAGMCCGTSLTYFQSFFPLPMITGLITKNWFTLFAFLINIVICPRNCKKIVFLVQLHRAVNDDLFMNMQMGSCASRRANYAMGQLPMHMFPPGPERPPCFYASVAERPSPGPDFLLCYPTNLPCHLPGSLFRVLSIESSLPQISS